jgi:hypothetical protein
LEQQTRLYVETAEALKKKEAAAKVEGVRKGGAN